MGDILMELATALAERIKDVCPVEGVSIGRRDDKATWRIDFRADATDEQKGAAVAVVSAFNPSAPSPAQITAERERRLGLGFNYDFGDARGVHRIETSAADMVGWDAVTKIAQAAINLGQPSATIDIVTNTGAVTVTALEWQSILLAAGRFQQPIWAKSFALQAMSPIPATYASDEWWTA